ncbi:MAG: HPr kinase/phosphorylase [Candidatus Firestonebacteria bacterium]|nr:HPr kinase/phosphorylase [Candidatus Firestonebacteria bacterium]
MPDLKVGNLVKENKNILDLELLTQNNGLDKRITSGGVNRPGLALAGYFDYFVYEQIQILGKREVSFLNKIEKKKRKSILEKLFSYSSPCFVITRHLELPDDFIELANKHNVAILRTSLDSATFIEKIINYLQEKFEPATSLHGVLVDIFGIGVLLMGKSGIGKSECALELIGRGHRIICDDVVKVRLKEGKTLIGTGASIIKHHMEIRGLGIINIKDLFGAQAIRNHERIGLVVKMEEWDENKEYDRIGLTENKFNILGLDVPEVTVPVRPGRNVAIIIEVAVLNLRLKKMGYNTARDFNKNLLELMQKKDKEKDDIFWDKDFYEEY